ncbi:MAG TPA: sodium:solute symporter family protein [Bacteroides sp.]|nr:sodium:solute symporter family protein [Bacteroides sp.]
MITWVIILGSLFILALVIASVKSYKKDRTLDEYMLAGLNIGPTIGVLTFAAALFSAFIFMGMPDMFRTHGIGAWIFLAISDGAMVFFIIWFGYHIRKKVKSTGFKGVSGFLNDLYGSKLPGYLFFITAFLFLVPYAAIQIRGVSIFFGATFEGILPDWSWALIIVSIMLIYAEVGGFKAIIYSDAIQGTILLIVIWLIGITCIKAFGSVESLFAKVEEIKPALLSVPGPNGLFTVQFLIASFFAIILIPVTQPQLTSRVVAMRDFRSLSRMAVSLGVFAILIIMSTAFIGMYGAVKYPDASSADYLANALLFDQKEVVGALAMVGLFAACLSTTNAQIFALGTELRSLMKGSDKLVLRNTRIGLFVFAIIALVFSTLMSDELALLARTSFTGTSMMAPVVLFGVLSRKKPSRGILILSATGLIILLLSLLHVVPQHIGGMRLDFLLYIYLALGSLGFILFRKSTENN